MMYQSPNLTTRYRLAAFDISVPIWMRGPGEATGAFALESAMDGTAPGCSNAPPPTSAPP